MSSAVPRPRAAPLDAGFLCVALLAVPIALHASVALGQRVREGGSLVVGDGLRYFAYLPSVVFDGDLRFRNDYIALGIEPQSQPRLFRPTATGHEPNVFPIGSALLWLPFYVLGHPLALILQHAGYPFEPDGRGPCYQLAAQVGTQAYVVLGLLLLYRLLCRWHPRGIAALAVTAILGGTPLLWYSSVQAVQAHGPSFFAASLLLYLSLADRGDRAGRWLALGAALGLLTITRTEAVLLAGFPLLAVLRPDPAARTPARGGTPVPWRALALLAAGFAALLAPQLLCWRAIYGTPLDARLGGAFLQPADAPVAAVLYSTRNGLLSWSPLLVPAGAGLVALAWRQTSVAALALATLAAYTFSNAMAADWWGGAAFGGRRFTACLPLFALGLAQALRCLARHPLAVLGVLLGGLLVDNVLNVEVLRREGHEGIHQTTDLGELAARRRALLQSWIGSPSTFPASMLFALRHGLAPAQFDLVVGSHLTADLQRTLEFEAPDHRRYLGAGWSEPSRMPSGRSVCWIERPEATVLVDLRQVLAAPLRPRLLHLIVSAAPAPPASARGPRQPLVLELLANGQPLGRHTLDGRLEFTTVQMPVPPTVRWKGGLNEIRFRLRGGGNPTTPRSLLLALRRSPALAAELGLGPADRRYLRQLAPDRHLHAAVDRLSFE